MIAVCRAFYLVSLRSRSVFSSRSALLVIQILLSASDSVGEINIYCSIATGIWEI